jgi:hypothetical protein
MHAFIRERLEDLLADKGGAAGKEFNTHLSGCDECSSELDLMQAQSRLVKSLRLPEEMEPSAGFYARVLQRIEERTKDSIWAVFIYSPVGKRLAYASLTLAVALGSYVITQETLDGHLTGEPTIAQEAHYDAPVMGSQQQQRDAVLINFAVHQGSQP